MLRFPYYPLHFLLVCFRIVLQNLYSLEFARGSETGGNFMTKYKFSNKLMFALVMLAEPLGLDIPAAALAEVGLYDIRHKHPQPRVMEYILLFNYMV